MLSASFDQQAQPEHVRPIVVEHVVGGGVAHHIGSTFRRTRCCLDVATSESMYVLCSTMMVPFVASRPRIGEPQVATIRAAAC
jgi:hypothetical protein